MLVPLAQAASSVDHWMEAVDAAGAATPLSDPSFEGTVFIPNDAVSTQYLTLLRSVVACGLLLCALHLQHGACYQWRCQ